MAITMKGQLVCAALLVTCMPLLSTGQILRFPFCAWMTAKPGLTQAKIEGTWWVRRQIVNGHESGWSCKRVVYGTSGNEVTFSAVHNGSPISSTGKYSVNHYREGDITLTEMNRLGVYGANIGGFAHQIVRAASPNFGQDVNGWVIIGSCTWNIIFSSEYLYVLTRKRTGLDLIEGDINAALNNLGYRASNLQEFDNSFC